MSRIAEPSAADEMATCQGPCGQEFHYEQLNRDGFCPDCAPEKEEKEPPMSILGKKFPDPIGKLLGNGYERFISPLGVSGLVTESPDRLDIFAIDAMKPGTGQFRQFIAEAKQRYKTICIWNLWHPWLASVLERYGFVPETEIQMGSTVTGMRWGEPI